MLNKQEVRPQAVNALLKVAVAGVINTSYAKCSQSFTLEARKTMETQA
jgi:hypothetical protein